MMLALKSGPQIAAKVGNPAGLLCRRIWYSVGKSGVLGITEYRQGRPLIGDVLYNYMAYADDITIFSTNAKGLQCLIDMCTMYSDRWRFKYGIEKSKCMIVGKSPFTCEPVWRLNDVSLRNVETIEILGNVFARTTPAKHLQILERSKFWNI